MTEQKRTATRHTSSHKTAFCSKILGMFLIATLIFTTIPQIAFAAETQAPEAERTVLLYACGADLETAYGMATFNLHQILNAKFSAKEKVNVIVMTGGSMQWQLESKYLYDPETGKSPEQISGEYNQIWEAKGADAKENPGKLVLLDKDGITGDGEKALPSTKELMSKPETLKAFINYGVKNYPAKKYDLILWDHGGGPAGGYGLDEHADVYECMSLAGIIDSLSDNDVIRTAGKFDFVDFDACLMNSVELNLALADYADYYIASPETEPGYGQDYKGWLNKLGEAPAYNTYELGKIIVDDFIEFYTNGTGAGQNGTLAVVDLKKLADSAFIPTLKEMNTILSGEADDKKFYDEFAAGKDAIHYEASGACDLGNLVSLLAVTQKEADAEYIKQKTNGNETNPYIEVSKRLQKILEDKDIIYGNGTENIVSADKYFKDKYGNVKSGDLRTSGMYIYWPTFENAYATNEYVQAMQKAIAKMKNGAGKEFLSTYLSTVAKYALIKATGEKVSEYIDLDTPKAEITYDSIKKDMEYVDPELAAVGIVSVWKESMEPLVQTIGNATLTDSWLSGVVSQQVADAISRENIKGYKINSNKGQGTRIVIENTEKRATEDAHINITAELPAILDAINKDPDAKKVYEKLPHLFNFSIANIAGSLDVSSWNPDINGSTENILLSYLKWYNNGHSIWDFDAPPSKVYALKDASGKIHAAAVEDDGGQKGVCFTYKDKKGKEQTGYFIFEQVGKEYKITQIIFVWDGSYTVIKASDLKETLKDVKTSLYVSFLWFYNKALPMTKTAFDVTPENINSFKLTYTDLNNISDIADTDGDGKAVTMQYVVEDIYSRTLDITDAATKDAGELKDIREAKVEPVVYNGQKQEPVVIYNGKTLQKGRDYSISYYGEMKDVGEYLVSIGGMGEYAGVKAEAFVIAPKGTSLKSVKALSKAVNVKWSKQSAMMSTKRISGYEVQLATNSKFTKGKKVVNIKGYAKTAKKVTGLKPGKKYYVRVRTYRVVDGKKIGSAWSKVKTAKVKR